MAITTSETGSWIKHADSLLPADSARSSSFLSSPHERVRDPSTTPTGTNMRELGWITNAMVSGERAGRRLREERRAGSWWGIAKSGNLVGKEREIEKCKREKRRGGGL
eukprot:761023-Hanusia_phi.AAC.1